MKLLFADDEKSLQSLMSLELPRMGHEVTVCPDGLTAVAALERNTYDCILVDLDMPGLNGIQVIAKAKEMKRQVPRLKYRNISVTEAHVTGGQVRFHLHGELQTAGPSM